MAEKVFPSSSTKPTINGTATGTGTATPAATNFASKTTAAAAANTITNKSKLYNPTTRPPYRPQQPHNLRRRRSRSGRRICCCCCFWSILILLLLLLVAAIAGAVLYVLYRPHRPAFSIPSLRIHRLNLTTSADSSFSHISTLLNLTIISNNPNSHLSFFYEPITISSFSSNVFIGNGSLPAFSSTTNNETSFRNVVVSGSNDLDAEPATALRSDLKKKNGRVTLKIQLDTELRVKTGGLKTKKVGIRVTCDGIKGVVPKGKSPTVAVTTGSKCLVDLRIKIWRFTF